MSCYIIHGTIRFDTALYHLVRDDGVETRLSKMEVEVLSILCEHARQTVTRQTLFDNAWPNDTGSDGHLNRVILLLRRKFDSLGLFEVIKTVPKVGYVIDDAVAFQDNIDNTVAILDSSENDVSDVLEQNTTSLISDNNISNDIGLNKYEPTKTALYIKSEGVSENKKKAFHSPLFIVCAALLLIACIPTFLYFNSHQVFNVFFKNDSDSAEPAGAADFRNFNFYSDGKISLFSTVQLNKSIQSKLGKFVSDNLRDDSGRYYIGISKKAISVLHMSDQHRSLKRIIYLREGRSLLEEFGCILEEKNSNEYEERSPPVRIEKNSITKHFVSLVSPSCPTDREKTLSLDISMTISTDAAERDDIDRNRFFYISMIGTSYDAKEIFSISSSGYVEYYMDDGVYYQKWNAKAKNINSLNPDFSGVPAAIKLIDAISNRESAFITKRITEGVYVSDILDGVIMSTH